MEQAEDRSMTEMDLYKTKFFDYRLMTPKTATLAFALAHFRALAEYKALMGDRPYMAVKAAEKLDPKKPEQWRDWQAMTRLRRVADVAGMTYECFWEWAFEAFVELKMKTRISRHGTIIPPFNAFLNRNLLTVVLSKHREYPFIRHATSPFFGADAYEGHPLQIAYYDSLLAVLSRSRRNCTGERLKQMIDDGVLSRKFLEARANKSRRERHD